MNWLEFERKLQKLNSRLYLQRSIAYSFNPELGSTGIYYKERAWGFDTRFHNMSAKNRKAADRLNSVDKYLGYCTVHYIPEGNLYDDKGSITAPGWREIVLKLSNEGYFHIDKARKVFKCSGLGTSSYDKKSSDEKSLDFINLSKPKYLLQDFKNA